MIILQTVERRTIRKVSWRLLPLIVTVYFVAYIDRTNVSFAALTMNKDLGLSPYLFGWGAGIFFLGYFLFEVPSNVILEKTGARIWIARNEAQRVHDLIASIYDRFTEGFATPDLVLARTLIKQTD